MSRIPSKMISLQTPPAYLSPLQENSHLGSVVAASKEKQPTQKLQDVHKSPNVLQESSSADKTVEIVITTADSFSLSRLPAPETTISAVNTSIIRIGSRHSVLSHTEKTYLYATRCII